MSEHRSRFRRPLALALAAGTLAVAAPAAIAVAGGGDAGGSATAPAAVDQQSRTVQENEPRPDRTAPRGEDCPERGGSGGNGSASGQQDPAEL